MESLKHLQFTKKVEGRKWMKKLIPLCRFVVLHLMVHESEVEGASSVVEKMCVQFKLRGFARMDLGNPVFVKRDFARWIRKNSSFVKPNLRNRDFVKLDFTNPV